MKEKLENAVSEVAASLVTTDDHVDEGVKGQKYRRRGEDVQ